MQALSFQLNGLLRNDVCKFDEVTLALFKAQMHNLFRYCYSPCEVIGSCS